MRRQIIPAVALAAAAGLAMSGCAAAEEASDEPFVIVYDGGLSGAAQIPATAALDATVAAADYLNQERNGILGREIVVESLDSGSDPTRAVSVLQEYIGREGRPDLVVTGVTSGETLAMLPVLSREGIPSFGGAGNTEIDDPEQYPYHFSSAYSSEAQMAALPAFLEEHGIRSVTALLSQDAFGEGNVVAIQNVLGDAGVELVVERFDPGAVDMSVAYERALGHGGDAVYFDALGESVGRVLDARLRVGGTEVITLTGGGVSGTGNGPLDLAGAEANENLYINLLGAQIYAEPDDRTPAFARFHDAYRSEHGEIDTSIYAPVLAWDMLLSWADAAEQVESLDPETVTRQLEDYTPSDPDLLAVFGADGQGYSPASHFPAPNPEVFGYYPSGPAKEGQFVVESS